MTRPCLFAHPLVPLCNGVSACRTPSDRLTHFEDPVSVSAPAASASRPKIPVSLIAGCAIPFSPSARARPIGAFQRDILIDNNWTRDVFSFAIALQNLLWGLGQPFAGAVAGPFRRRSRTIAGGRIPTPPASRSWPILPRRSSSTSAGVLIGLGLSGSSFNLVLGAFGPAPVPDEPAFDGFRPSTGAGSLGQFLFSPLAGRPDPVLRLAHDLAWLSRRRCSSSCRWR